MAKTLSERANESTAAVVGRLQSFVELFDAMPSDNERRAAIYWLISSRVKQACPNCGCDPATAAELRHWKDEGRELVTVSVPVTFSFADVSSAEWEQVLESIAASARVEIIKAARTEVRRRGWKEVTE